MSGWFTKLEEIAYTVVEFIPGIGTIYSFRRAEIAHAYADDKRFWVSVTNCAQSAVRDVVLLYELAEPVQVVIVHTMVESLTDKLADIFTSDSPTQIKVDKPIDTTKGHVLIGGKSREHTDQAAEELFKSKVKGVHHFHRSTFTGRIVEPKYAPNGEKIWVRLPGGLYDGARVSFVWRWTQDAADPPVHNRPDHTFGRLVIEEGDPTRFKLATTPPRKGFYDFWGTIIDKDTIEVKTNSEGRELTMQFKRQIPT